MPWETLDALSHQLELCGVGPDTTLVALLPDDPGIADLLRTVLGRSGADVIDVRPFTAVDASEPGPTGQLGSLVASADFVLDATADGIVTAPLPGVPVLRLSRLASQAHLYPPHANLARRLRALLDVMRSGAELRVTDRRGTDLRIALDDARLVGDDGRPSPGTMARFPGGWACVVPAADRLAGTVILMPGDANLTRGTHLGSPIRLEIERDRVTTIDGDNPDGDTLRALFEHVDDTDVYGVASINVGLNPGGLDGNGPFSNSLLDDERSRCGAGVVRLAFGDNEHADRPVRGTIEFALAQRTVTVDDTLILQDGELVGELAPDVYERRD